MSRIPEILKDEQVADIASTGFSASENANLNLGDSVAVFAEGPIGLCATVGAKLRGAGVQRTHSVLANSARGDLKVTIEVSSR
jgi:alcohol dehydrogenase